MRIKTIITTNDHWTTQWIPISYKNILSNNQMKKSVSFIWSNEYILFAICRAYYINDNIIEIGDVWLNEKYRGKKINNEKISVIFMKKIINKIWKKYPNAKNINLIVAKNNIPAIKLYKKLNFNIVKPVKNNKLGIKNALQMSRFKKI